MKVAVQFATNPPTDWLELDLKPTGAASRLWRNLPKKAEPTGSETIDSTPGWLMAVSVDGCVFEGFDSYAVELVGTGASQALRVYGWVHDVDDFTDPQALGYRWAERWTFHAHRPDPRFGGRMNTHQTKTVYAEDMVDMGRFFPRETSGGPVDLRPWSEFSPPADALVRHGVWLPESLWKQHYAARRPVDWKAWS